MIIGMYAFNDEGILYNNYKWHSFEGTRIGVGGKVLIDKVWAGDVMVRKGPEERFMCAVCRDIKSYILFIFIQINICRHLYIHNFD